MGAAKLTSSLIDRGRRARSLGLMAIVLAFLLALTALPARGEIGATWVKRWGDRYVPHTQVAVGGGQVYAVSGSNYPNMRQVLRAWDLEGDPLWAFRLPSIDVADAEADETGVFLVGSTAGSYPGQPNGKGVDAIVIRVHRSGDVAWVRQFFGQPVGCGDPCEGDECRCPTEEWAVAATLSGKALYVIGETTTQLPRQVFHGGERDGFVAKFSSSGRRLWLRQFGTPASDEPNDIAVRHERIAVVGDRWGGRGPYVGFARLMRPDGSLVWKRIVTGANTTDTVGIIGRTLILGRWRNGMVGNRGSQIVLTALGWNGATAWSRVVSGSKKDDWVNDAVAVAGLMVFAGGTNGSWANQPNQGEDDVLLLAVASNGETAWHLLDGSHQRDSAGSIAAFERELIVGGSASGSFLGTSGGSADAFALRMHMP